jgi:hypothetical protein
VKKLLQFTETQGMKKLARGGSTVVEQSPHHPEVKGLSPPTSVGTGREKMVEKRLRKLGNNKKMKNIFMYSSEKTCFLE